MLIPTGYRLNKEQSQNVRFFNGELASRGMQVFYAPFLNILYTDLNRTLTDKDLRELALTRLDKKIARSADNIMKLDCSEERKVYSIAKLLEGRDVIELAIAGSEAALECNVPRYISGALQTLDAEIKIFTHLPIHVALPFVDTKIRPMYSRKNDRRVTLYCTELEYNADHVYTGRIVSMPNDSFRAQLMYKDWENFLKENVERGCQEPAG